MRVESQVKKLEFYVGAFLTFLFLQTSTTFAERQPPFPAGESKNWGFIDKTGTFVIKPEFDSGDSFTNGFASVQVEALPRSYKIIDKTGRGITSKLFARAGQMSDGFAPIVNFCKAEDRNQAPATYISKSGAEWNHSFAQCGNFEKGFALSQSHTEFAVIDTNGNIIRKLEARPLNLEFSEGLASVRFQHVVGYINTKGDVIIKPQFRIAWQFHEGLAAFCRDGRTGPRWGFINMKGEEVIPPKYVGVCDFKEGLAQVRSYDNERSGFIDKSGKLVISLKSTDIGGSFSEGLASVRIAPLQTGFIDRKGKIVFKVDSNEVGEFHEGLCYASSLSSKDRLCGFVNKSGEWVIKPQFYKAMNFSEGLAAVCLWDEKKLKQQRADLIKSAEEYRRSNWWQFLGDR